MPLSRTDLPCLVDAIRILYRVVEDPRADRSWMPAAAREAVWPLDDDFERLGQAGVIAAAGRLVLHRMMPGGVHTNRDCADITDSQLDQRHKTRLLDLRDELRHPFFGHELATDASTNVRFREFLEGAIRDLVAASATETAGPKAVSGQAPPREPGSFLDSAPLRQAERAAWAERQDRRLKLSQAFERLRFGGGGRTWNSIDYRLEMPAELAEWVRRSVAMAADFGVGGHRCSALAAADNAEVSDLVRQATHELVDAAKTGSVDAVQRIAQEIQTEGLTLPVFNLFADACGRVAARFRERWKPPAEDDPNQAEELAILIGEIDKWEGRLALLFRPPAPTNPSGLAAT